MKFPYLIEFDLTFFWYPYIMYGKYDELRQAKYYGHIWFLIISLWLIEIAILKKSHVQ
jgi:hypothetical protein